MPSTGRPKLLGIDYAEAGHLLAHLATRGDIRLVSLDLDRTLVASPGCVTPEVRAAFRMARDRGKPGEVVMTAIASFISSGRSEYRPDRLMGSFELDADDPLSEALRAAFQSNDGELTALPGAVEVVQRLAAAATVIVVSNGYLEIQSAKLRRTGLDRFVFAVVASEAIGLRKPDPAIFAYASQLTGIGAEAAVHIGDSLAEDVVGANAAGYASVLFGSGGATELELQDQMPSARVSHLGELLPLLNLS